MEKTNDISLAERLTSNEEGAHEEVNSAEKGKAAATAGNAAKFTPAPKQKFVPQQVKHNFKSLVTNNKRGGAVIRRGHAG